MLPQWIELSEEEECEIWASFAKAAAEMEAKMEAKRESERLRVRRHNEQRLQRRGERQDVPPPATPATPTPPAPGSAAWVAEQQAIRARVLGISLEEYLRRTAHEPDPWLGDDRSLGEQPDDDAEDMPEHRHSARNGRRVPDQLCALRHPSAWRTVSAAGAARPSALAWIYRAATG